MHDLPPKYLVVTKKTWNIKQFNDELSKLPGEWCLITEDNEFTLERVEAFQPGMIFFPHWNARVPNSIVDKYFCVCFHETDLPFGRGGSPIQNLISRGISETKITALKMVHELDAGPILLQRPYELVGSAQAIFEEIALIVTSMIKQIVAGDYSPREQEGKITEFKRRTPAESEIKDLNDLAGLFDHIRMLDAEGYPKAFIEKGGFRFEFDQAQKGESKLSARVTISSIAKGTR